MDYGMGDEDGLLAEINVTPLVDVMLVLLIVFMITAPMLVAGIQVELPRGGVQTKVPEQDVVTLVVDRDGILYWEDEPVHVGLLGKRLEAVAGTREIAVQLRADAAVDYGTVMEVLDTVREAGIVDVGLVTQPRGGREWETGRR